MGGIYLWSRRHDEAVREFEKSISLDPNFALGYMMLGLSLYYEGKSERALDVFDRAFALDPYHPDVYLHFQAQAYFQLGQFEKAVEILKRRLVLTRTRISGARCSRRATAISVAAMKRGGSGRNCCGSTRITQWSTAARCCHTKIPPILSLSSTASAKSVWPTVVLCIALPIAAPDLARGWRRPAAAPIAPPQLPRPEVLASLGD